MQFFADNFASLNCLQKMQSAFQTSMHDFFLLLKARRSLMGHNFRRLEKTFQKHIFRDEQIRIRSGSVQDQIPICSHDH